MSQNIQQIFVANPAASMQSTDLLYLGRSPYDATDDFAITFANFVASIGSATATASTISKWDGSVNFSANNFLSSYATTATAAATTTLTVTSAFWQFFTGVTTQTIVMPLTSTLVLGQSYFIVNNSTGVITVQSSGANTIQAMAAGTSMELTCILTSGTTAASWQIVKYSVSDTVYPLSLALGGTNNTLTASNGGILWSDANKLNILAGTATARQLLVSGASGTPAWTTSTYPTTNAINTLLYASAANVMSALSPAASSFLITNGSSVPSFSSTVPAFTTSAITFNPTTGGIVGTTTNDNVAAGKVGEYISSNVPIASGVSVTTATSTDITSISLTAGDWDVFGNGGVTCTAVALSIGKVWTNTTSATAPNTSMTNFVDGGTTLFVAQAFQAPYLRVSVAGTTTVYLSCQAIFGSGTTKGYGSIFARRVR